ncbi:MAG: hypothetical protein H6727_03270 [Myxococcales bacterium]|nr:hypothetical protein [Myxococcales bacterium]
MSKLDQFESVFKAASKERFHYSPQELHSILVVTDLPEHEAKLYTDRIRDYLPLDGENITWATLTGDEFDDIGGLFEGIEKYRPDLICTYRNLKSQGWQWPYSLGEYLDVLTQATTTPVLVYPHPEKKEALEKLGQLKNVMAVTDHLAGDDRLVNFAISVTPKDGTLYLSHIEDKRTFDRYIEVIGKIPALDTDVAKTTITQQLLKEPRDYIQSCRDVLAQHESSPKIEEVVQMGTHLDEYKRLIEEHQINLLVLNTKDADQLAMHGLAYPLAVELKDIPMLML